MSRQNGKAVGADTVKKMCCVSSDPQDTIRFAKKYLDLGVDQLYLHCAGPNQKKFLQDYGRDVLPALRKQTGESEKYGQKYAKETACAH